MEITVRSLWTMLHGMGFGALYLLACSGAILELYRLTEPSVLPTQSSSHERFLKSYLIAMVTATVLGVMPTSQAGVASAVFNASREVAGLLGITVIGAVLTSRQGASLAAGHSPADAYLTGYHWGLVVAMTLVLAGGATAFAALRQAHHSAEEETHRDDLVLAG